MKVLFCGLKYDYGQIGRGLSFEYRNFYQVLCSMEGVEAEGFFFDEKVTEVGRDVINPLLIKTVEEKKPDLLFCFLFTEEIKKETIRHITEKTSTKTFNWFADDHWRLPVYSRFWAPMFTLVSTTDSKALAKYESYGIRNVVKTQWAANTLLYQPLAQKQSQGREYGITFVGKKYGARGGYLAKLKATGLPAEAFGSGWDAGFVDFENMLEIFYFSKINLNFTESPYVTSSERLKFLAKFFLKKKNGKIRPILQSPLASLQSFLGAQRRQIKGRTFEVPACGGFLLTDDADNLRDYYEDGKEIVIFKDQDDMVEKCRYYIKNEQARKAIARAGYERTLRDHTYEKRFGEIFKVLELT